MTTQGYSIISPQDNSKNIIHIHVDSNELNKVYNANVCINVGVNECCDKLEDLRLDNCKQWQGWRNELNKNYVEDSKPQKNKNRNNFKINFNNIINLLKKEKITGKTVGGYYPYNYEVDAIKILEDFEKKGFSISLPKIKKKFQMNFFKWSTRDPLVINKFGIPEPISDKILYPSILIVPLVAFDKNLNRIGYGGGFYDRYIKKQKKSKKILTIGLAYPFQRVKKIPIDKYDIRLDFILTN